MRRLAPFNRASCIGYLPSERILNAQTREPARPAVWRSWQGFASTGAERTRMREHPQASYPPRHAWTGPARLGPRSETKPNPNSPGVLAARGTGDGGSSRSGLRRDSSFPVEGGPHTGYHRVRDEVFQIYVFGCGYRNRAGRLRRREVTGQRARGAATGVYGCSSDWFGSPVRGCQ